jgi:hypothetical protein
VPADAAEGVNHFGRRGHGGPCPPRGAAHHYRFVRRVLEQANAVFVRGSGTIHYGPGTIAMAEPAHTGNCPGPSSGTLPPAKAGALSRYR